MKAAIVIICALSANVSAEVREAEQLFGKAMGFVRADQLDAAIPIFRDIVSQHPRSDVAEFAATQLLDAYNRLQRYDELVAFANELDASFLRGRPDLADVVVKIRRQALRRRAENLRGDAAGEAYLELYNAIPRAPDGDELLYNAGVSFEDARSMDKAMRVFELLRRDYPHSKITIRATGRLGKLYADLAMYDRAAETLEEYAKKYAGEKDAYAAMSDAVFYRKAIGDRTRAIEDTKIFIKTFGAKRPREAADAMWSLTALYDGEAEIKHLREYLRSYGAKGSPGRVVIAHAKIGQRIAKQSCPHRLFDGLCVKLVEQRQTCRKGSVAVLAPTTRDTKKAHVELTEAVRAYERVQPRDDVEARYYYAQALLAIADHDLEAYLALEFPRGLDFDAAKPASTKRFSTWLEQKQKAGAALSRQYEAVLATKDAASSITAAARLATIAHDFAASLTTAEIPHDIRRGPLAAEKQKAYCSQLTSTAEPLEERAVLGFGVCLAKSTELSWFADSSQFCERQLARLEPAEFPLAREVRGTALNAAPVIAAEPPL